ncbi:Uncharacterized protein GBIM_06672, partial [Gryllus bimaculatus]
PQCRSDGDCADTDQCQRGSCVDACRHAPCGVNALCTAHAHRGVCSCPPNYVGNPHGECTRVSPPVGCSSNAECSQQEACVNRACVNPCNCGPNADCRVNDHFPICFCKPGYSGNALAGCFKVGCQSDGECSYDQQCYNGECVNPCLLGAPCAVTAECYGDAHRAACRCPPGFAGDPFRRCERAECRVDSDCPRDKACLQRRCVDPCAAVADPPCAANALCFAQNHAAGCRCPEHLPAGDPFAFCEARPPPAHRPECRSDVDCPSRRACIRERCQDPCAVLRPCHPSAACAVLDSVPVRTMVCECPDGWVPDRDGQCRPVLLPVPPGCTADTDCPATEACISRMCRNPCNCGANAKCLVQNHRPVCSCEEGFEGNANIACHTVGCRSDSECDSGKACVNGHCVNPCLVKDPCGVNAECYAFGNRAECRCRSGYRGNPYFRCYVVGCRSNNDCPGDRACVNAQCVDPCVYGDSSPCAPRAQCRVHNHLAVCRCPPGFVGNPYVGCRPEPRPECRVDGDCASRLACLSEKDPCAVLDPCRRPADCVVVASLPVRTLVCVCPGGYVSSGSGTCKATPPVVAVGGCVADDDCALDRACVRGVCRDPCACAPNADCRVRDHKPVCACKPGFDGNPNIECTQ